MAFKDEDYYFDDIPEVATKLVSRWAKLWQDALSRGRGDDSAVEDFDAPLDIVRYEGKLYSLRNRRATVFSQPLSQPLPCAASQDEQTEDESRRQPRPSCTAQGMVVLERSQREHAACGSHFAGRMGAK